MIRISERRWMDSEEGEKRGRFVYKVHKEGFPFYYHGTWTNGQKSIQHITNIHETGLPRKMHISIE